MRLFILALILLVGCLATETPINSFEDCIDAGNPAMESYPRQCRTPDGEVFVENITLNQTSN